MFQGSCPLFQLFLLLSFLPIMKLVTRGAWRLLCGDLIGYPLACVAGRIREGMEFWEGGEEGEPSPSLTLTQFARSYVFPLSLPFDACHTGWLSADYFDNVITKFIVNNRTDALKTDINLFFTMTDLSKLCALAR